MALSDDRPYQLRANMAKMRARKAVEADAYGMMPFQRAAMDAIESDEHEIVILSAPRSNGKSYTSARICARLLSADEDDALYVKGSESVLVSASRAQARIVTGYLRKMLPEKGYSYADSPTGAGVITHLKTRTRLLTFSAVPKGLQGLSGCRVIVCDEVSSWRQALECWTSIETGLGKGLTTVFAISTIAPSTPGNFWHELCLGPPQEGVKRFVIQGERDTWSDPDTIRKCNPVAMLNPRLENRLRIALGKAHKSERKKREFLNFHLNLPSQLPPNREPMIPDGDWERVMRRKPADPEGECIVGLDMGSGCPSWAAAAAYWPASGRIETRAWTGGIPTLDVQASMDSADITAYEKLQDAGELVVCEAHSEPPVSVVFDWIRSVGGKRVISDSYREAEVKRACKGVAKFIERGRGNPHAPADLSAVRAVIGDRMVSVGDGGMVMRHCLSDTVVTRNENTNLPVVAKRHSRAKTDCVAALLLCVGYAYREMRRPESDGKATPAVLVCVSELRW